MPGHYKAIRMNARPHRRFLLCNADGFVAHVPAGVAEDLQHFRYVIQKSAGPP